MNLGKSWKLMSVLVVLMMVGSASAVILLTQRQPAVPVGGTISGCATTAPFPTTVQIGVAGQMTFSCDSSNPTTSPAFTTTGPLTATPLFTGVLPPYNASRIYIYTATGAITGIICSSRLGNQRIENGVPEVIPAGAWNYCAEYDIVVPPGLPEFTIEWTV